MPGMEATMHEFKGGKLKSGSGKKVTDRKQAIAIAMNQERKGGGHMMGGMPMMDAGEALKRHARAKMKEMHGGT